MDDYEGEHFTISQKLSLNAVKDLIRDNGAFVFISLDQVAYFLEYCNNNGNLIGVETEIEEDPYYV